MKSNRILLYLLIFILLLVVLLVAGKKQGWFGNEGMLKVAVEKGSSRDIVEVITANGKIQPETEVKLTPDVSGEIVELAVKEGDHVKKGTFLLKIKPENYIMARNRAEATLNNARARQKQAEAQLELTRLNYERSKQLFEQKAIAESEYEQATTNYNSAKAEKEAAEFSVQSALASLKEAEENLIKTSIYAPMSGTVSMLNVEQGERVVGTELMSGTEILRIADLERMEVEVEVNENDIVRVALGDTALIEVDAYNDARFKGVVTEIPVSANTTGLTTDQVTNFKVKILLLSSSYKDKITATNPYPLRPGMSATADIQTNLKRGVFSIPIQCVTTRVDSVNMENADAEKAALEQTSVVFVVREGKSVMVPVKTGIQDNTFIEITEGLTADDEVVKAPYSAISKQLKDQMTVEVVPEETLFKAEKKK